MSASVSDRRSIWRTGHANEQIKLDQEEDARLFERLKEELDRIEGAIDPYADPDLLQQWTLCIRNIMRQFADSIHSAQTGKCATTRRRSKPSTIDNLHGASKRSSATKVMNDRSFGQLEPTEGFRNGRMDGLMAGAAQIMMLRCVVFWCIHHYCCRAHASTVLFSSLTVGERQTH